MGICKKCFHRAQIFDEYIGECVKCLARKAYILPDPLKSNEIDEVEITGKCEFFNKEIYFDKEGFARIKESEGNSLISSIYD